MTWLDFREPVSAWTHFAWLVMSLPATWLLWQMARGSLLKRAGVLIFGASCALCYAGSWLYHAVPEAIVEPFHALDHVAIYLFIAGTTTPIGLVVLRGRWRVTLLLAVWMMALTGIVMRLTANPSIQTLTAFYLIMGWTACLTYFELARRLGHAAIRPIWIGGVFYSVGAVINALHWPVLAPGAFESHDLFHLFVMAGSACHYYFMQAVIVPFPNQAAPVLALATASTGALTAPLNALSPAEVNPEPCTAQG